MIQELPAQHQSRWSAVASINNGNEDTGYTCSAYRPAHFNNCRLCILNKKSHTAEIYEVADQGHPTPTKLPDPPPMKANWRQYGVLNSEAFSFEPSFIGSPPLGRKAGSRKGL